MKILKHYIEIKRIKNFVCVEIHPQVNPDYVVSVTTGRVIWRLQSLAMKYNSAYSY